MSYDFIDPYTGEDAETCSASFKAQQSYLGGASTGNIQTEAEFNKSKLLGELGVMKGKFNKGEIPDGTKVLSYTNTSSGGRGYYYVKGGKLHKKVYLSNGASKDSVTDWKNAETLAKSDIFQMSIPQAVAAKPKPETVELTASELLNITANVGSYNDGQVVAVHPDGSYIKFDQESDWFVKMEPDEFLGGHYEGKSGYAMSDLVKVGEGWLKPDGKAGTPKATPKKAAPSPAPPAQVAAPVAATPVNSGSTSVGSMSHEDVSALFVKIKDDLAKEQGLNIKGANSGLDAEVYAAIGKLTGYTPEEVKGKIDAYKAAGNKLSALKKKVMAGTYKIPTATQATQGTKPQATKASPAAKLNTPKATSQPVSDPKPNGVPTVATPKLADAAKDEVKKVVAADPAKVYTDEDIAGAYIIAKDAVVAASNGKWTLYSKSDELDALIYGQIKDKTGFTEAQAKVAIAQYLGSGKKLSALKKQLAKQGAFKPQADTLKGGTKAPADAAAKKKDAEQKADAGYTPTPTPATGKPPTDTGKPAPNKVKKEAEQSGDISKLTATVKAEVFKAFKATGSKSWLSSGTESNYEGFAQAQIELKAKGYDLTLLQLIRVVDEEGAKKAGVENGHLFEKQVVEWLSSPQGTKYIKDNEKKLAEEAAKKAASDKAKAEAEAAAKKLEANQPPLPPDSAQFQPWTLAKAKKVSQTWLDAKPWTDKERRDLTHYTGSAYTEMNTHLRTGGKTSISDRSKSAIKGSQAGMRPTTEPILVQRGSGASQFTNLGLKNGDGALTYGLTGKTFKDEGFLSTSAGGQAAFGGEVKLEIECPVGTPMAYVAPISKFPSENEMLLQAGMEYKILNVRKEGTSYIVRMRVVNWPGKEN